MKTTYEVPMPNRAACTLMSGRPGLKRPVMVWINDRKNGLGFKRASGVVEFSVAHRWAAAWESDDRLVAVLPCTELLPYTETKLPSFV